MLVIEPIYLLILEIGGRDLGTDASGLLDRICRKSQCPEALGGGICATFLHREKLATAFKPYQQDA